MPPDARDTMARDLRDVLGKIDHAEAEFDDAARRLNRLLTLDLDLDTFDPDELRLQTDSVIDAHKRRQELKAKEKRLLALLR
jgi:hypothetical protein